MGKCKVKINGKKIWVYAPDNLTGIKEGELLESGTLYKHPSGKWTIIHSAKEKLSAKATDADLFIWVDFAKKQYWHF